MVVDEAHKAKNFKTKTSTILKKFPIKYIKILLTGTPVQNNLEEFYTLLDTVQNGIYKNRESFKILYSKPIERGLSASQFKYGTQEKIDKYTKCRIDQMK